MTNEVTRQPTPQPPSGTRPASSQPSTPWRGAEFEQALHQAAERRQSFDAGERQATHYRREDEMEPVSGREGERSRDDRNDASSKENRDDRLEALMGGMPPQGAAAAMAAGQGVVGATGDVEAMAKMMEKAWLAAQADAAKGMQVQFTDRTLSLAGFGVTRMADGGLSLQLASHQRPTPEMDRALELMRKRLEQRGVNIGEVTIENADGDAMRLIGRAS